MDTGKCRITKYTYGTPFCTDAVVEHVAAGEGLPSYITKLDNGFTYQMDPSDVVYGLGENVRGINKRGWHYISNNSDEPNHREDRTSLYASHNFIIVDGQERVHERYIVRTKLGYGVLDYLAVCSNYGAVIVVVTASAVIHLIRKRRVEDKLNAFIKKRHYMTVRELCRVANRL